MRRALGFFPLCALCACASSAPNKPAADPAPGAPATAGAATSAAAPAGKPRNAPDLKAEVGALDAKQAKKNFEAILQKAERCQDDLRKQDPRLDFLAGELRLEVRVGEDGKVKHAFLPRSTVGDLRLESCVLEAARGLPWPRPEGGLTGIAANDFSFPMKGDREATPWPADRAQSTLASAALQPCKNGLKGAAEVTLYVDTDGKVIAAGASQPDPERPEVASCIVKAVSGLKFPSPGSWPAKVTVPLR